MQVQRPSMHMQPVRPGMSGGGPPVYNPSHAVVQTEPPRGIPQPRPPPVVLPKLGSINVKLEQLPGVRQVQLIHAAVSLAGWPICALSAQVWMQTLSSIGKG